jgi:hypothetical protein
MIAIINKLNSVVFFYNNNKVNLEFFNSCFKFYSNDLNFVLFKNNDLKIILIK